MSDNGDFEPMELFKHYHPLSPHPKEKTFLETIADVDEDGDGDDMMEYFNTQVSATHTVSYRARRCKADDQALSGSATESDLDGDSPHVQTPSTTTLSSTSSVEPSYNETSEPASSANHDSPDASATSMSMGSESNKKRGTSRSQTISQSYIDIPFSYNSGVALSRHREIQSHISAGEASSSASAIAPTPGSHLTHTHSNSTIRSNTSGHSIATEDEKINQSTQSIRSQAAKLLSSLPPSPGSCQASTIEVESVRSQSASSQESSSHSTHHSTSTDEPGVVTPELHPSRLDVTVEDSDDQSSTPPLSPDNDISMMADTTIGTIKSDEDVFYNGDFVSESAMDFAMAKTDSE